MNELRARVLCEGDCLHWAMIRSFISGSKGLTGNSLQFGHLATVTVIRNSATVTSHDYPSRRYRCPWTDRLAVSVSRMIL